MLQIREIPTNYEKPRTFDYYGFQTKDRITKYLLECPNCKTSKITKFEKVKCSNCSTILNIQNNQMDKTFIVPVFLKYSRQLDLVPTGVYYLKDQKTGWWIRHYINKNFTQVITIKENGYYFWYKIKSEF